MFFPWLMGLIAAMLWGILCSACGIDARKGPKPLTIIIVGAALASSVGSTWTVLLTH